MGEVVETTDTLVDASSLVGLRLLKSAHLLESSDSVDDIYCSAWSSNRVHFVDHNSSSNCNNNNDNNNNDKNSSSAGAVALLNLGGQRLHHGWPSAEALNHFPELSTLNLGGTDLPLEDIETVLSMVANSIECIHIGGNGLGNQGAEMIARWLCEKMPANLVKIDLRYNDIDCEGMEFLCEGLQVTRVNYLHLEGNQIGDAGCAALSQLLKHGSCKLEEVFLGANKIGAAGAAHLASSLERNSTLTKLYLEGNSIGLEGASAFSEALEELKENKKHLKNLFVDNNNIGQEGSQRLAKALDSGFVIPDGI
jgi:Ran GTPase-activating protein (RanGAP) involved in mRNA processing and transport